MREPAIIARISLANALAVERQIEDGKAYFARFGRTVPPDNVFIDNGVSASAFSTKERREYLRALAKIEAGDIDHIWMWAEDRTHRQVIELAEFIQLCREHSVRVATAGTEYDLSDPDQVSMWFIKVRFAEAEVEKLSRRMKRQTLQAAEKGLPHPTGRRAFGERGRRRVKDDDGNFRTVPVVSEAQAAHERDLIREAASRILAGDSLRGIVTDWNARGIAAADGGQWRNSPLRRVLLSPRVAGYRDYQGKLYPGDPTRLPPILDEQTWEAVRTILTDPSRRTSVGGGQPRHLLTGLLHCGTCDRPLRARMVRKTKSKAYRVYYCHPVNRRGGYHVYRDADRVDDLIEQALFHAIETDEFAEAAAGLQPEDPTKQHHDKLARITADLDVLSDMLTEAEVRERQGITLPRGRSTRDIERKIAEREAEAEREWAAIERKKDGRVRAYLPKNIRMLWPDFSLDRKRSILKSCIEWIKIHPQRGREFDPDAIEMKPKGWT